MKISTRGLNMIADFEGLRLETYLDVVGVPTIGYGHTGKHATPGNVITVAQAKRILDEDLDTFEAAVTGAAQTANQNQFDAMVSLAYNIGVGAFKKSTVLRKHLAGDYQAAARAFGLWNKAGGKVWPGLTRRRNYEAALYLEPVTNSAPDMPQKVDPETRMVASPINKSAIGGGTIAATTAVVEATKAAADIKKNVDDLGAWLVPALLLAVAGLFGYIAWHRWKQRDGGWA